MRNPILKTVAIVITVVGVVGSILRLIYGGWEAPEFFILGIGLALLYVNALMRRTHPLIQIAVTLTPFILFFIYYKTQQPSIDTYLIPKDFRGPIYIYYDQPNGTAKEYEGSRRIYRIPSNGVLLTEFGIKGSSIRLSEPTKYYLVDKFNNKLEIKSLGLSSLGEIADTLNIRVINGGGPSTKYGKCSIFYVGQPTMKMKEYIYAQRNNMRQNEVHERNMRLANASR